jgi:hypothetical protein
MHGNRVCLLATVLLLACSLFAIAQQSGDVMVPPLVNFSGMLRDGNGQALTGVVGVTFCLYSDQQGGTPLWIETQNVQPDKRGHYSVMLGSTTSEGLPPSLFASGEARWLGVQVQGQEEQPRVMLLSVPYAMKAGDAQTVGGLPASAFVLAEQSRVVGGGATSSAGRVSTPNVPALRTITGSGTAGFLPKFTGAATISNSALFQSGSSPTAKIGINTSAPTANLDVNGSANVRGNVSATGRVSASAYNIGSNPFAFGSFANSNAFLGFAGNSTMTGRFNTAVGESALSANTNGESNSAIGLNALIHNTSGTDNEASGVSTLLSNTSGGGNVADGAFALIGNTTGNDNIAVGYTAGKSAGFQLTTGSDNTFLGAQTSTGTHLNLSNAAAIGALAQVDASNSMVLGSINGVNGATADTAVGIGTTNPLNTPLGGNPPTKLNIVGNNTFVPLVVQSPSTFGTWMALNNTSSGGKDWAILSTASGNGEGAGNLGITDFGAGGHIILESNVGIGAAPDNTLTVNGSADKPGGGFWGVFSDRRLKTTNGDFTSGLEQVLKIKPVRYRYKDENALGIKDQEEHIGLVAQEVQRVIPEAVTENSKGYLVVNNEPILWAMLNAIKQQQNLIRKQQHQILLQQTQIASLASQLKIMLASHQANGQELQVRTRMVQTGVTH